MLGLRESASRDEIRRAFWRRAKQVHPDRDNTPEARATFLALNEAYHVLRHRERRQNFDAFRKSELLLAGPVRTRRSRVLAAALALAAVIVVIFVVAGAPVPGALTRLQGRDHTNVAAYAALMRDAAPPPDPGADPSLTADPELTHRAAADVPRPSDVAKAQASDAAPSPTPDPDPSPAADPSTPDPDASSVPSSPLAAAEDDAPDKRPASAANDDDTTGTLSPAEAKRAEVAKNEAPPPAPPGPAPAIVPIARFPSLGAWEATASQTPVPLRDELGLRGLPATLAVKPDLAMEALLAPAIEPEREAQKKKHARKGRHGHDRDTKTASNKKRHHAEPSADDHPDVFSY